MDNFEYSIQLNDRDWAEFYLATEECSLIQAALATAEEQLPSDPEEGEVEENRPIRVRLLAPSAASCLPRGVPRGPSLAEEVLSGSEDETELGSVSRFLWSNSHCSAAFPQPSATRGSQPSRATLEPSEGQHELPELARDQEALLAAEETESVLGDRLARSGRSLPVVDAVIQKEGFQTQICRQAATGKSACSLQKNMDASKDIDSQAGDNGIRPPGLDSQQLPKNVSQTVSVDVQLPLSVGSDAVCRNPESPESRGRSIHPTSVSLSSAEPEVAERPEKGTKHHQDILKAEVPSPSLFQGHPAPLVGTSEPSEPMSENHKEGRSNEEEHAANIRENEGQADQSGDLIHTFLNEGGRVNQEISSAGCQVNVQKFPGGPEANKCPQPTTVTDSRCCGTLGQHKETSALKGQKKDGMEDPCNPLGTAVPFEGESPTMAQGSQKSNFSEDNIPCCLALENSLESNLTAVTRSKAYERFFHGSTQEQAEKMQKGVAEERPVSDIGQDLPEMYGPEMYEYFFNDLNWASDGEGRREKEMGVGTVSGSVQPLTPATGSQDTASVVAEDAMHISVPEVYEHFFNNGGQDRKGWKHLLLSMPASEAKKAMRALKSLLCKPGHLFRFGPTSSRTLPRRGSHGKLVIFSPVLLEENRPGPEDLRMAVMSPERPLQLALTHRDMCLGFVAFASWAVKTSNLQAPDAWKIVFLANFGTLSAIRYFRRQVVAGGQHEQGT